MRRLGAGEVEVWWAATTDQGPKRASNEDAWGADPRRFLFVVADGMGGHAAGEVASRTAVDHVLKNTPELSRPGLRASFEGAHRAVLKAAEGEPGLAGMGTTLVALATPGDGTVVAAAAGDSPIYLARDGAGRQVTENHEDPTARGKPLTNCVGVSEGSLVKVDLFREGLLPGDVWLLCSDGVSDVLDAAEFARLVGLVRGVRAGKGFPENTLPQDVAALVLRRALKLGAEDNLTVVAVYAAPKAG